MFQFFRKQRGSELAAARLEETTPAIESDGLVTPQHPKLLVWRATIDEIHRGFARRVEQARVDAAKVIATAQVDSSEHEVLWDKVDGELSRAQRQLYNAWNRMHSALWGSDAVDEETLTREERRLDEEGCELELLFEAGRRESRADAARSIRAFAMRYDARMRSCEGCGAHLGAPLIVQAQVITCRGCGTRQNVEPGIAFHVFASSGARWLGEWYAFPDYQLMKREEVRIGGFRKKDDVPLAMLQAYHDAALDYWSTALGIEVNLVPYLDPHLERMIDARMKEARKLLRSHWQWRGYEKATAPDDARQPPIRR